MRLALKRFQAGIKVPLSDRPASAVRLDSRKLGRFEGGAVSRSAAWCRKFGNGLATTRTAARLATPCSPGRSEVAVRRGVTAAAGTDARRSAAGRGRRAAGAGGDAGHAAPREAAVWPGFGRDLARGGRQDAERSRVRLRQRGQADRPGPARSSDAGAPITRNRTRSCSPG